MGRNQWLTPSYLFDGFVPTCTHSRTLHESTIHAGETTKLNNGWYVVQGKWTHDEREPFEHLRRLFVGYIIPLIITDTNNIQ